jgi:glutathione synthase/RimK-type ligase-like ATP-grasp enzyme
MTRIALVTCAAHPLLDADDRPLVPALRALGAEITIARWDDEAVDWRGFDAAVVRNTWDYHERRDEYVAWADRAGAATRLHNPAGVLRWNTHKGYLRELAARGVPIVDTVWHDAGAPFDVRAIMSARGWSRVVVKPAVSAGARHTYLIGDHDPLPEFDPTRDLMVQPYLPTVTTHGERSLIFLGGELSHAIRKHPALTTNKAEGGEPLVDIADDERALAAAVLAAVPHPAPLLYARVDMLRADDGTLRLMELEVTEPRLFFTACPPAVDRLSRAILA